MVLIPALVSSLPFVVEVHHNVITTSIYQMHGSQLLKKPRKNQELQSVLPYKIKDFPVLKQLKSLFPLFKPRTNRQTNGKNVSLL